MTLSIDHFVVGAADLDSGRAWAEALLRTPPGGGGQHPQMGTHNALWKLGDVYLEVIAINPSAPTPDHPRWFGLDDPKTQDRLAKDPKLLTWAAASDDLQADISRSPLPLGRAMDLRRDTLRWQLTVTDTGLPHWGGVYPSLIQWPAHVAPPPRTLPDSGLALSRFSASGPKAMWHDLTVLGAADLFTASEVAEAPSLQLDLSRPDGQVITIT